jgi:hypothetical protein
MKNKNLFLIFGIVFFIGLILSILSLSIYFISASSFGELKVTEEHPFLINGSWIPASDLKVGDELTTISGKKVRITSIEDIETKEPFPVYNLEAGEYSNFVADGDGYGGLEGVVVHNSNQIIPLKTRSPFLLEEELFASSAQADGLKIYPINKRGIDLDGASLFNRERSMLPRYYQGWQNIDDLRNVGNFQRLTTYSEWREVGNVGRAFDLTTHLDSSGKFIVYNSPANGKFIWTLDFKGKFSLGFRDEFGSYVYRSGEKILPHSVLSGGQPVFGAGEIVFVNGRVVEVNAWSGHYVDSVGSIAFNENTINSFKLYAEASGLSLDSNIRYVTSPPSP